MMKEQLIEFLEGDMSPKAFLDSVLDQPEGPSDFIDTFSEMIEWKSLCVDPSSCHRNQHCGYAICEVANLIPPPTKDQYEQANGTDAEEFPHKTSRDS